MENSLEQLRTVGVVMPAFNEAEKLLLVLNSVCAVEWLQEIVLVDDGSTDATLEIAQRKAEQESRLAVIHLTENQGKAAAMLAGVKALHTDLVIFLDADLMGLKSHHLLQLVSLQRAGSNEMALAVFQIGRILKNVPQRFVPHLSGQRCLWRDEAEQALLPLSADRYGVETGLTLHARNHHWKIRKTIWYGITHHMVWQKRRVIDGIQNRWQMYSQIMTVIARNRYVRGGEIRRGRSAKKIRLNLW
jgi:glycosyltransferase involved in cell wall biosynthesis